MARSASAPSPSAAKAAVSTSASGEVVEVVSVSFVSFNVSVIWLSSNLPCAWGVVLSQPLSLWAHQHTVPHRKCRCQIPTSLAERYVRPSRRTRHRKNRDPPWHTLCNISSDVCRFNCPSNEKTFLALDNQRAKIRGDEIHL